MRAQFFYLYQKFFICSELSDLIKKFFALAGIVLTLYYVMGSNANKVIMKYFSGVFYSGNIDDGISLDGGISWSSQFDDSNITRVSTTFDVRVSPTNMYA